MRLPVAEKARGATVPRAARDTEALWREFHAGLRSFVGRRVRSGADADDIVQKMFLQVHRTAAGVRDDERIHAWLHQIARNAIADHYRAPARAREVPSGSAAELDLLPRAGRAAAEASDADGLEQAAACLRPMIDRLPAIYRRALTLVEIEGRSQTRAARMEGLSVPGMKARVQRGRARLRQLLLDCCDYARAACGRPDGCAEPRGCS